MCSGVGRCLPGSSRRAGTPEAHPPDAQHRLDRPAHDPCVLADLATAGEPVLLEELDRGAEQEPARRLATGGHLGDGLDEPAAEPGDLVERALQAGPGDALTAMPLVDVEAGDPPIRSRWRVLVVFAPVLDARELLRAAVLAPALGGAVLVDDQRGMSAAGADPILLGLR